jgi:hypothetical protein
MEGGESDGEGKEDGEGCLRNEKHDCDPCLESKLEEPLMERERRGKGESSKCAQNQPVSLRTLIQFLSHYILSTILS